MIDELEVIHARLLQAQAHGGSRGLDLFWAVPIPSVFALFGDVLVVGVLLLHCFGWLPDEAIQPGAQLSKSLPGLLDDPEPALLVYQHAVMGHLDAGEECTFLYLHGALLPSDEELLYERFVEWQQHPGVLGSVGKHLLGEIPRPVILLVALV